MDLQDIPNELTCTEAKMFPSSVSYIGSHKKRKQIAEAFNDHFPTTGSKFAFKIRSKTVDDHRQYLSADL